MRKPSRGATIIVLALALLTVVPLGSGRAEAGCYYCDTGDDGCNHCFDLSLPGPEGQVNCSASCSTCRVWGSYCSWV
jgi:hypothetical protein